jgi:hypothetical protein
VCSSDLVLPSLVDLVAVSPFSGVLVGVFKDVNVFIEQCARFEIGGPGYPAFLAEHLESINFGVEGSVAAEHAAQPKDLASLILPGQVNLNAIENGYMKAIIEEIHRKELIPITRTENYIKCGTSIFRCYGGTTLSMRPNEAHCKLLAQKIIGIGPYDGINGSSRVSFKIKGEEKPRSYNNSTIAQLTLLGEYYRSRKFPDDPVTPQTPDMFVEHLKLKMEQTVNNLGLSMMALDTLEKPYTVVSPFTGTPTTYKPGTPLCALVYDLVYRAPGYFDHVFTTATSNEERFHLLKQTQTLRDALESIPETRDVCFKLRTEARSHIIMGTARALQYGVLPTERERTQALTGPPSAFGAAAAAASAFDAAAASAFDPAAAAATASAPPSAFGAASAPPSAFGAAPAAASDLGPAADAADAAAAATSAAAAAGAAIDTGRLCELSRVAADIASITEKFEGAPGIPELRPEDALRRGDIYKMVDSLQCLTDVAVAASCLGDGGAGGAGAPSCSSSSASSVSARRSIYRKYELEEDGHSDNWYILELPSRAQVAITTNENLLDDSDSQIAAKILKEQSTMAAIGQKGLPRIGGRYPSKKSKRSKNGTQHKRVKLDRVLSHKLKRHHLHRSHRKSAAKSRRSTQRRKSNK